MKLYSVSEYNQIVKSTLEKGVGLIAIQGEITGFRVQKDKLVYFELKDEEARCLCFMMVWDMQVKLEDGMEIKAYGVPSLFLKSGGMHFRVTQVELVGAGALAKQFEMLKKKLEVEGLFAPERKRALPRFPERVGLITSHGAAAYNDVLRVLSNRWGGLDIQFYPAGVQGFGAIEEICEAFRYFNEHLVDVIILTRGGGSLEDLQAFNSEAVARAVFGSRTPVVCGVGHERDISIADLVADVRAATPSNAAEIVVPDRREVVKRLAYNVERVEAGVQERIKEQIRTVDYAVSTLERFIRDHIVRLNSIVAEFRRNFSVVAEQVKHWQENIASHVRTLQNLNPLNLLKRGYSVVYKEGKVVRDSAQLEQGDAFDVHLHHGRVKGTVI